MVKYWITLKTGNEAKLPAITSSIQYCVRGPCLHNKRRKEILSGLLMGKLSLSVDTMIVFINSVL